MTCKVFYTRALVSAISRGGRFFAFAPHLERGDMIGLFGELVKVAAGELWAALVDAKQEGDLRGHLAAWWAVMTGAVDPGDTYRAVRHGH